MDSSSDAVHHSCMLLRRLLIIWICVVAHTYLFVSNIHSFGDKNVFITREVPLYSYYSKQNEGLLGGTNSLSFAVSDI